MFAQKLLSVSLIGTDWVLYLLVFLSIVSLAIIIEKLLFLHRNYTEIAKLQSDLEKCDKKKGVSAAESLLSRSNCSASIIGKKVLTHAKQDAGSWEENLSVLLSQEKVILDSRMVFLGTIVSTAPFIGLLGTVLGIIKAFHGLSLDRQAGNMVMAGIAESLIATALGLFIAIPAVAAYNYFVRLIKKTLIASENFSHYLMLHYK